LAHQRIFPHDAMTRVLLADDQAVVRAGLRTILETDKAIEVVGEANDGREAVTLTQALDPDVVMMDIRMPVLDGIKATEWLMSTGTRAKVLMLTTYGLDEYVYAALRAGAAGFMLKTEPPARLCEAVHVIAAGDALLGSETTRLLIERYLSEPPAGMRPSRLDELTSREQEVLLEVAKGRSNEEIGSVLFIGPGTVKTHVTHILTKLGLRDRVQAVVFAYETGLIRRRGASDR
jgi:DNA-binding NarL/FixJ family response regulator